MTAFNTEINVMGMSLSVPDEPENSPMLKVNLTVGQVLPLDSGDGNPLQVPLGQITFAMNKDAAQEMGKRLTEEAEKLPAESKLAVVSVDEANRVVEAVNKFNENA